MKVFSESKSVPPESVIVGKVNKLIEELPEQIKKEIIPEKMKEIIKKQMDPYTVFLLSEINHYNSLIQMISHGLSNLVKALKCQKDMSEKVLQLKESFINNKIPEFWKSHSFISSLSLTEFLINLNKRIEYIKNWASNDHPKCFDLRYLFSPSGLLLAYKLRMLRKLSIQAKGLELMFEFLGVKSIEDMKDLLSEESLYVEGTNIIGGTINLDTRILEDSESSCTVSKTPILKIDLGKNIDLETDNVYKCPLFRTKEMKGYLQENGFDGNFISYVDCLSEKNQKHWISNHTYLFIEDETSS